MTRLDRFSRNLDWNLLKYFVQIARSGSIGAAAARLNISQPAASTALRRLEGSIGAELFVRTQKGVKLTVAGVILLKDAEEIAALIAAKPAEIGEMAGILTGPLTVKTVSHVYSTALDNAVIAFKARHPAVELSFAAGPWPRVLGSVANGEAMVGISFVDRQQLGFTYELLTSEVVQLYCGVSHPLFGETVTEFTRLSEFSFIEFNEGEPPSMVRFRTENGIGRRICGVADSLHEAVWMVGLGLGVSFLPEPAIAAERRFRLWPLLAPELAPTLDIHLVWRDDLADRAALLFVEMVRERMA
jgi:DNA-binding transcriptional LysR family regulator